MKTIDWTTVFVTLGIMLIATIILYSRPSNATGGFYNSVDRMANALEKIANSLNKTDCKPKE